MRECVWVAGNKYRKCVLKPNGYYPLIPRCREKGRWWLDRGEEMINKFISSIWIHFRFPRALRSFCFTSSSSSFSTWQGIQYTISHTHLFWRYNQIEQSRAGLQEGQRKTMKYEADVCRREGKEKQLLDNSSTLKIPYIKWRKCTWIEQQCKWPTISHTPRCVIRINGLILDGLKEEL